MPAALASAVFAPTVTAAAARRTLAGALRDRGCSSADLDARLLVCAACGFDHAALVRDPDHPLGAAAAVLERYAARRLGGEPVSRILGRREFWGLTLLVDEAVLDPRPETEGLVAAALDAVGGRTDAALRILELGLGSGAVLCALLREFPRAEGVGVDRSPAACRTAARNLARHFAGHGHRAHVVCGDWSDAIDGPFDLVVSNPPYIPSAEIPRLDAEVRLHDPPGALDGGVDGLDAFRAIVPRLGSLLAPGGTAALECGWRQGATVAGMMRGAGLGSVAVLNDLAGRDRIVTGLR